MSLLGETQRNRKPVITAKLTGVPGNDQKAKNEELT